MWASLFAQQHVHSPTAVNPDIDAELLAEIDKREHIVRWHSVACRQNHLIVLARAAGRAH
jgi:hypothetical protein